MTTSVPTSISLKQAKQLLRACGQSNTFIFVGEPGSGKTAIAHDFANETGMEMRYFDCALLDLGDLQMPKVSDEAVSFVPNELFVSDKPCVYLLDEIGKAMRPVQNALLSVINEHRIGSYHLPKGSIVFATTNNATDGVGDSVQAHAINRATWVEIKKPDAEEWFEWGVDNDVDPAVLAWVKEYPQCMESYTDYQRDGKKVDNPYIFDPSKPAAAFVSPRSLYRASHIVKQRANLDEHTLKIALAGTIGRSAAADMQAFLSLADALPSFSSIVENPSKAKVPDSPIAAVILALGAVARVSHENINAWMEYIHRLPAESQFVFAHNAMRSKAKSGIVANARGFTTWAQKNSWAI
jgi:hypothetical protein